MADNACDVIFQLIMPLRVLENNQSRALNPTSVMQTKPWRVLVARMWVRIPAAIQQNEHRADLVAISRCHELLDAPKKSLGIPLRGKVMEKHPNAVEAQPLSPAQLAVDGG